MQFSSALILAAIAKEAVALRLGYNEDDWDTLEQDLTWPAEDCCRLYRNPQFYARDPAVWGAEYDYVDFCTTGGVEKIEDLSGTDLDDQVESYKCGRKTAIRFCVDAGNGECPEYAAGESGAGGSESQDLGLDNQATTIKLTPYDPDVRRAATVYELTSCHGHQ